MNELTDTSGPGEAVASTKGRTDEVSLAQIEMTHHAYGPVCRLHIAIQSVPTATNSCGNIYSPEVQLSPLGAPPREWPADQISSEFIMTAMT